VRPTKWRRCCKIAPAIDEILSALLAQKRNGKLDDLLARPDVAALHIEQKFAVAADDRPHDGKIQQSALSYALVSTMFGRGSDCRRTMTAPIV
jgi:hypothetical protein